MDYWLVGGVIAGWTLLGILILLLWLKSRRE
ncbi:hypothetical protein LCGC14_1709540 [marine sediment metagenome]|uniref:Uncharacterized protein n=1 Tax=marine sediment metagenome TaxID=412755 RepID=A0A0F9I363_9ZZZZ